MRRQADFERTLTVTKGGAFDPGSIDIAGSSAKRVIRRVGH
jgi:hypothetical protein